ncbi:hypothetical protein V8C40DRAFT_147868 [Trichoderma camerunense]
MNSIPFFTLLWSVSGRTAHEPGEKEFHSQEVAETGRRCEKATCLVQREDVQANKNHTPPLVFLTHRQKDERNESVSQREKKKEEARTSPFPSLEIDHVALGISEGHVNFLFLLLSYLSGSDISSVEWCLCHSLHTDGLRLAWKVRWGDICGCESFAGRQGETCNVILVCLFLAEKAPMESLSGVTFFLSFSFSFFLLPLNSFFCIWPPE